MKARRRCVGLVWGGDMGILNREFMRGKLVR